MAPEKAPQKFSRSWDALTPPLADFILEAVASMGFNELTPVQAATLPLFRGNKDVVVEAVTGSGKTLAYLIPIIDKILRRDDVLKRHHVGAIIVSPTRELATQIHSVLSSLISFHAPSAEFSSFLKGDEKRPDTIVPVLIPQLLVGGTVKVAQDLSTFLRLSPNILVGTPGRLSELLSSPYVHTPQSSFEVLVLDEADRLLDQGFQKELQRILGFLPKQRRTGLFSASVSDAVGELVRAGLRNPQRIAVTVKRLTDGGVIEDRKTPASLQMSYLSVPASQKWPALIQFLRKVEPTPLRTIIFVSSCFAVKYFHAVIASLLPKDVSLIPLHGKQEPQVREKCFDRFVGSSSPSILLTTDVAARGLDIPQVDVVFQFDPPSDPKTFVHRAGRAGRAGRRGLAVALLLPGREQDYVGFLEVRKTPITPLTNPEIKVSDEEVKLFAAQVRKQATADREVFQLSQRAFVSWARSYIEHKATSIFRITDVDWLDTAQGWGLVTLPKMPELKGSGIDRSLGHGIDIESIPFKDKAKEKKRQEELAQAEEDRKNGVLSAKAAALAAKRKKNEAWSGRQGQEDTRTERRERKQRKREAVKVSKMTDEEKAEQKRLEDMIAEVRRRNQEAAALASKDGGDDGFEGFD
ncbi:hypothetical protein MCOR27_000131 [Pyricularia oryzae]|uniref:ATP-dependent RNA helicase n=2 Tax=Pyricularia TaxID=48558 RepID=A0ABQ8NNS8_PYRGI|nr:hypothetical protein MCOR01_006537 [Pyricularia oryzae]KAI6298972.1 hypothetical protein MCOR33_005027 [Pyricularia grisea]KAH9435890.1 hypothetical protein MCOR02_004802 [Pyricularia oryzae]KAI6254387.1 hypothetical protein MCOR19_009101 [Pyricularia oryzae]KAI6269175.1 hypothetical protein MCOR26_008843 [Pyricularia oryzae]